MRGRLFVSSLTLTAALLVGATARGDALSEGEELIGKGIELREKGRDEQALTLFRQAFAKSPSARAQAQVALAEQALGMWVLADADLTAALASEQDPWIAKNRGALEGALAVIRKRVTTLEVRGADGAEVYLDGVKVGTGAGPFRVEAGRRTLEVRASGHHSTSRVVELPPGGIARETVALVPSAEPAPSASGVVRQEHVDPRRPDPGKGQRLLGWVFVGTGAALLATGAVGVLVHDGIVADYNASKCPGLGTQQPASCEDQITSSQTWMTVAIVSFVGGGAFALGGAALTLSAPSAPSKTDAASAPRLACGPGPAVGLACAGVF